MNWGLTMSYKSVSRTLAFFKRPFEFRNLTYKYSARRLIGSRIIESAAYSNQKLLSHFCLNRHKTRHLIESFGYCYHF